MSWNGKIRCWLGIFVFHRKFTTDFLPWFLFLKEELKGKYRKWAQLSKHAALGSACFSCLCAFRSRTTLFCHMPAKQSRKRKPFWYAIMTGHHRNAMISWSRSLPGQQHWRCFHWVSGVDSLSNRDAEKSSQSFVHWRHDHSFSRWRQYCHFILCSTYFCWAEEIIDLKP